MILLHDISRIKNWRFVPDQMPKIEKQNWKILHLMKLSKHYLNLYTKLYLQIWQEYQKIILMKASIVHQIDKLEMALQAKMYQKKDILKKTRTIL